MKHSLLTLLSVFHLFNAHSQGQWQWANTPDSAGSWNSWINGLVRDNSDNIIATGFYAGPLSINNNTFQGTSQNFFVSSTNSNGLYNWIKTGGSTYDLDPHGICTDVIGNSYIIGSFNGTMTIESSVLTHPVMNLGFFMLKYSPTGTLIWAKKVGERPNAHTFGSIACSNGFVYITGGFKSTNGQLLTIGDSTFMTSQAPANYDIYYARFDTSGAVVSAQTFGGQKDDGGSGIAVTQNGEVLFSGYYTSASVTIGNNNLSNPSSTLSSIFIAKLGQSDNVIWTKTIDNCGGTGFLSTDNNDNIFLVGSFSAPQINVDNLYLNRTPSPRNVLLAKFDALGNTKWLRGVGGTSSTGFEYGVRATVDNQGDVFIHGSYKSSLLTIGNFTLGNSGSNERVLIARYNQNGDVTGALSSGSENTRMYPRSIIADQVGNIYVGGYFEGDRATFGTHTKWGAPLASFYMAQISDLRTGIIENREEKNVLMFPNPALDAVRIKVESSQIKSVRVFNTEGKEMVFYKFSSNEIELPVSTLVDGVYFLEILTSEKQVIHKKVVKLK